MTSTRRAAPGFWLNLPDGWLPLEPGSERIPDQVQRLVELRAQADPRVAEHRGQVEQQLRAALKEARAKELSFGAILATFTADGRPITASLALTRHRSPGGADAHRILAELGDQRDKQNTLIELPYVGTVVRSAYLDRTPVELPAGQGRPASVLAEIAVFQYFMPMPGGSDIVVATGATPTLPMREVFGSLFDAILTTFQFVEDDPAAGPA